MTRTTWFLACVLLLTGMIRPLRAEEITPAGKHLAEVLDSMQVEKHWLAGETVHWRTGKPDPKGKQGATHCSAFVAAVGARLGIYLLRPPEHSQELLASAQHRWLEKEGREHGWKLVSSPWKAQELANRGVLVVASFQNPDRHKPGHIAVVRPQYKVRAGGQGTGTRDYPGRQGKPPEHHRQGRLQAPSRGV